MCQLEHFLLFVKFLLKLLVLKIKIYGTIYWEIMKIEKKREIQIPIKLE